MTILEILLVASFTVSLIASGVFTWGMRRPTLTR